MTPPEPVAMKEKSVRDFKIQDDGLFVCRRKTVLKDNGGYYIYEEVEPYAQSKQADGVEGALQDWQVIETYLIGPNGPGGIHTLYRCETIRHALQSAATLRAKMKGVKGALKEADHQLANSCGNSHPVRQKINKALASLGE